MDYTKEQIELAHASAVSFVQEASLHKADIMPCVLIYKPEDFGKEISMKRIRAVGVEGAGDRKSKLITRRIIEELHERMPDSMLVFVSEVWATECNKDMTPKGTREEKLMVVSYDSTKPAMSMSDIKRDGEKVLYVQGDVQIQEPENHIGDMAPRIYGKKEQ